MHKAAALLGVSDRYLYKLAQRGILPLVRRSGRTLISRAALERLIAEREVQPRR
jgi:excisionase family DNA binding protein